MLYKWYVFCIYFVYIFVYFAKFANSNPQRANRNNLPIRTWNEMGGMSEGPRTGGA